MKLCPVARFAKAATYAGRFSKRSSLKNRKVILARLAHTPPGSRSTPSLAIMHCPNCSANVGHRDAQWCANCGALFGREGGWAPVEQPVGPVKAFRMSVKNLDGETSDTTERPVNFGAIAKALIGVAVACIGLVVASPAALISLLCTFSYRPGCGVFFPILLAGSVAGLGLIAVGVKIFASRDSNGSCTGQLQR